MLSYSLSFSDAKIYILNHFILALAFSFLIFKSTCVKGDWIFYGFSSVLFGPDYLRSRYLEISQKKKDFSAEQIFMCIVIMMKRLVINLGTDLARVCLCVCWCASVHKMAWLYRAYCKIEA